MDFAMLPPEVNSGRIYAGPGSAPLLAAAEAWGGLAVELHSAANSYQSVISGLTAGPWLGPSSASMATAAASYVAWLSATALQAEETAMQVKAAAAAYEEALAATVPPPLIAANRAQLTTLVATNLLGQNTPAIAATEAQYAEMWAQDAVAMYGYAGSSATATALRPFTPPRTSVRPDGTAIRATAGDHADTAAGNVQRTVSSAQQAFSAVPSALHSFAAAPAAAADPPAPLATLASLISIFVNGPSGIAALGALTPVAPLGLVGLPYVIEGALSGIHEDQIISGWAGVEPWPGTGSVPPTEFPAIITHPGPLAATSASAVSAGLGEANKVGALSVPPAWTVATPAVRPVALAWPATSAGAPAGLPGAPVSPLSEMAVAGMAGSAIGGTLGSGGGRDGGKAAPGQRVTTRAGRAATPGGNASADSKGQATHSNPRPVVTGVAARIREIAKLRDEGRLTDEEFSEQKKRLLGR
ncbi:hypothetical protein BMW24_012485 [Mycobacterium heckeshornense]|uniref:Putative PPE family protein PPE32 n=1 Tax=Mycobacterium heckeshornense TaxID=110505 RepID=A0A2G8B9J0_9MYCO|nr:PPE domain-containing protein [Mycobacterium heckeshornense]KMV21170.1 PPE family protein [Mycobacterium heckeshornense]MCV7037009.1 PPE domain-containing protein [Mycobacterium heckeshornense]PIJ34398.1 hypothetical protein BMW24_012485 [Mycobacterium heckeshornense]BCO34678.1 putative PPE family protein PPE32 [Mycobacterium heckeshornense]